MAKRRKKRRSQTDEDYSFLNVGISQETWNSIAGILSLLVVVVSVLAFLGKAGTAGQWLDTIARMLFGWGFFVIPVAFAMLGIAFIKSIHRQIAT